MGDPVICTCKKFITNHNIVLPMKSGKEARFFSKSSPYIHWNWNVQLSNLAIIRNKQQQYLFQLFIVFMTFWKSFKTITHLSIQVTGMMKKSFQDCRALNSLDVSNYKNFLFYFFENHVNLQMFQENCLVWPRQRYFLLKKSFFSNLNHKFLFSLNNVISEDNLIP